MRRFDILEIYKLPNTVFTTKDVAIRFGETDLNIIKARLNYYVRTKRLIALRRGVFAKDKDYDKFELATKIYTPAYISLETVLQREGMIFQYYRTIFVVSYLSREIVVDGTTYLYRKIKDRVLTNLAGIETKDRYFIASRERAFLDVLYLYGSYHFDNLGPLNWDLCFQILPIYENKALGRRLNRLFKEAEHA